MKNATCNSHQTDLCAFRPEGHGETRREYFRGMTFLCYCFDFKMNKINQGCVYDVKNVSNILLFFYISIQIKLIESSKGCGFDDSLLKHLGLKVKAGVQKGGIDDDAALATRQWDLLHRK